ncbi:myopalladin [Pelobates cultripes]|uniref:Myopalladin n=2 Tax=Pelobates cultripes TaxID=61616 RepID=A0AAD1T9M1_PELCU|nr:myopalladin [Pelobates cultripes]CAH2322046.1 myopalladin [Pelobates cultripes]
MIDLFNSEYDPVYFYEFMLGDSLSPNKMGQENSRPSHKEASNDMQDNNIEDSSSISQILRENYLAENRILQDNSEHSTSISSSHSYHHSVCSSKVEELVGSDDLLDLSAFLNQEELDQSVHLARQSIDQDGKPTDTQTNLKCPPRELKRQSRSAVKPPVSKSSNSSVPEKEQLSNFHQDHVEQDEQQNSAEGPRETKKTQQRFNPYGTETENKKEFLNKAADFIEELSSLFKANSSKRIRPKTLKNRRSKRDLKSGTLEEDISNYTSQSESRERSVCTPVETEINTTATEEIDRLIAVEPLEAVEPETDKEALQVETDAPLSSFYLEETIGQPPNFIQKIKSREVTEGSKVQLDCIVVGIPRPEVRWYCEGKELENSPDIQIQKNGDINSLIITEAFEEDTGRYSCFASNIYGTDSTSAEIYVEGASSSESEGDTMKTDMDQSPSESSASDTHENINKEMNPPSNVQTINIQPTIQQSASPTNYLQGLDGRPLIAAPVFTKTLQDLTSSEGQLVVFESRVKGSPSPKVEWYREGTLIDDSPDFRILQKKPRSMSEAEEICTLVIAEVFAEDSGMFTCTASNKYGTTSSTAFLTVKGTDVNDRKSPITINTINIDAFKQEPLPPTPPLVEPPPKPKLEGVLVNHNEPRPSSKIGLRVHFNLPEDDKGSETSSEDTITVEKQFETNTEDMLNGQSFGANKEPPPVFAKPKLDRGKLQQLHNQVMFEQQLQPPPSNPSTKDVPPTSVVQNSSTSAQPYMFARPLQFLTSPEFPNNTAISKYPASTPGTLSQPRPWTPGTETSPELYPDVVPSLAKTEPSSYTPTELYFSSPPPSTHMVKNHFQAQTVSPTPVSPPRIQNSVAFLSSVLPSLPPTPVSTNAMGLPKSTSLSFSGTTKKNSKSVRFSSHSEIRENKDFVVRELERKLSFRDELSQPSPRQQEYKISNFEQRLMNEIEFRLERTPVDESDDDIQHDEIPTGKCIAPIFDRRLKHFRVVEGTPVTFTCKVVGIPIPKVYWFKDGKQISKKNEHCKMSREGDGTCSLHIEFATNDDDGNYTIMAANPQGRISCSGHLIVQTAPLRPRNISTVLSHRVRPHLPEVENESVQERFFRPYFLQAPGDMVAHEGRLCRLDCKVSGLPTPDIMWLLNGTPVSPDVTHKMLVRENGIHSLLIDPISQSDAGTYTCIATNKTGQNSFSLELSVMAKEVRRAPIFLEKLQNCGVPEGHPVRLESRVVGMPPPVFYWKKDNETIPVYKQRFSMHQDTTGYVCLLIQPARKEDAGWYTLSAKNEAGIVSCTARLDIYAQWHHQIPQSIKKIRSSGTRYSTFSNPTSDFLSSSTLAEAFHGFSSARDVVESDEL